MGIKDCVLWGVLGAFFMTTGLCTAWATTFAIRPMENLTYEAPTILRGTVVSSTSDWGVGGDGGKRIYTVTEIEVKEAFKSASGQSISPGQVVKIRELGGEKDGIAMQVPGAAQFQKGEDTVVFLGAATPEGMLEVRGLGTGKYEVLQDEKGHEYLSGGMLALAQTDTSTEKSTLDWPLEKLRTTIATQRSKPPAPLPAGPVHTVTVEPSVAHSPAPVAQPLHSPMPEATEGQGTAHGRAWWKWVLGVLLGGLGYAWMRRRT